MERFKPEIGDAYHFLDSYGQIMDTKCMGYEVDQFRYEIGNCFRTEEECQAKIDRDRAIASGRAVVVDVPEGWEVRDMVNHPAEPGQSPAVIVVFKRTPPPPPKEVVVKVYDVEVHGDPIHGRLYVYVGKGLYIYPNEAEGL